MAPTSEKGIAMGKYEQLAQEIVEGVGGAANVQSLTHCVTRLRFKLKNEGAANDEAVEKLKGVLKLIKSGGQYQVVIGPAVNDVYDEVVAIVGEAVAEGEVPADDAAETKDKKGGVGSAILDFLTSALGPALNLICAGGIIKGVVALLSMWGVATDGQLVYELLNAAGDAVYYFMPVALGYTLSKRLKMDPIFGIVLGAALVYPDIQSMEGATLFGIDYSGVSYTSTMFPIVLIMLAAAPLYHVLEKVFPASVKGFLLPAVMLLIAVPVGYLVIGPIVNMLSSLLGNAIAGLYDVSPVLCGIVMCGVWQILVLFGIHMGLAAVIFTVMFSVGTSVLYPMTCIPCFAQFGICLAVYLRSKDESVREVALPATISAAFGTTEPAIYGITLPRIKYFALSCVVSAVAGAWMGFTNVTAYQLGGNGFLCPTIVLSPVDSSSIVNFLIAIAFTAVVSFVATCVMWRDEADA